MSQMVGAVLFMNKLDVQKHQRERGAALRCAGCGAMQKKNEVNILRSQQVLFLSTQLNSLYANDPQCGSETLRRVV